MLLPGCVDDIPGYNVLSLLRSLQTVSSGSFRTLYMIVDTQLRASANIQSRTIELRSQK